MSNQAYYGQQPQYPPQAYGHRPHGDGYYQQGPPQMQYAQMPLNQNNAPAPRRQKDRGCLMAWFAHPALTGLPLHMPR
ncbi:MAG: hypothetical protein M1832_005475 [Thelocarpon impressellum]|nr:MAG: hypothetical protein M1832_005475 [Thelocarpon impressellum]